jgi:hypothetical protein
VAHKTTLAIGAVLLIAATAGFVGVPEHAPMASFNGTPCAPNAGCPHTGFSQTVYDLLRITTWALVVGGAILVIVGLINYARRPN